MSYSQERIDHYTQINKDLAERITENEKGIELINNAMDLLEKQGGEYADKKNPARRALMVGRAKASDRIKQLKWDISVNENSIRNMEGK